MPVVPARLLRRVPSGKGTLLCSFNGSSKNLFAFGDLLFNHSVDLEAETMIVSSAENYASCPGGELGTSSVLQF